MGLFHHESDEAQAYEKVNSGHKSSITHEVLAGAVSYQAAKAYQQHLEKNGKPASHAKAKELLAGFAGAALDHLVETKGLDFIDKQKAKKQAEEALANASSSHY